MDTIYFIITDPELFELYFNNNPYPAQQCYSTHTNVANWKQTREKLKLTHNVIFIDRRTHKINTRNTALIDYHVKCAKNIACVILAVVSIVGVMMIIFNN